MICSDCGIPYTEDSFYEGQKECKNCTLRNKYFQWAKDNGNARYELTDVFINDNGEFKKEKKMAWVLETNSVNWRKFCEETDSEWEEVRLILKF